MNRALNTTDDEANDGDSKSAATSRNIGDYLLGTALALTATLLITLALFLPMLRYSFAPVDDVSNILSNPYLANPAAQDLGYFFRHPYYFVYMPITFCLWALCARIAPLATPQERPLEHVVSYLNPAVFHAASLILHLGTVALVFAILRRLRFAPWASAAGALVFALHPVQVEAVAWVTGANNLTAGFFSMLAINLYLAALPANPTREDQPASGRGWLFFTLATASFVCALLSKPAAAVLPLLIAVIEAQIFKRNWRRWIGLLSFWCLLSVGCVLIASSTTAASSGTVWSPIWGRLFVAGDALAFYLVRLFVPLLTIDNARAPRDILHAWWGYADWLLPALVLGFLWVIPQRKSSALRLPGDSRAIPWARVAVLLFLCGLIPTLGLVPFYSQWFSTVSDRYLYASMLGPAVLMAYLVSLPKWSLNGRVIGASFVTILMGCLTALQLPIWSTPFSFVEYAAATAPSSPIVHVLAGNVLFYRSDFDHALTEFELAEKLLGTETLTNNRMIVNTLVRLGRYDDALKPMANIVLATPDDKTAWLQLWSLLPHIQDSSRLEEIMRQRLSQNPNDARASFTLGAILLYRGSTADAQPYLANGVQGSPDFSGMQYDFGVMLEGMNQLPAAKAQYERALTIDPGNKQASTALGLLRSRMGQ